MAPEQLQAITPLIAAAFLALALLLFLASLRMFRKSRTDFYWRRRRAAGQRGWRMLVLSISITLMAGVLCIATGLAGILYARPAPTAVVLVRTATPTATLTPTKTDTPTASPTPRPTNTATATSTPMPPSRTPTITPSITPSVTPIPPTATATATLLPPTTTPSATRTATAIPSATATLTATPPATVTSTLTPTATATATATVTPSATDTPTATTTPSSTLTPTITPTPSQTLKPALVSTIVLESSVTPSADATISITAVSTQISGDFGPVNPATSFKAGFSRVYFFVNFSGMQSGVLWRRELVYNDQVVQRLTYLWGREQDGNAYFFFGQEGGFKAGRYEIRLFIGESDSPAAMIAFTVS